MGPIYIGLNPGTPQLGEWPALPPAQTRVAPMLLITLHEDNDFQENRVQIFIAELNYKHRVSSYSETSNAHDLRMM
jgi:hypothetical protein